MLFQPGFITKKILSKMKHLRKEEGDSANKKSKNET